MRNAITTALLLAIFTTSLSAQFAPGVSLSTNMIEVREVRVVDVDGDLDMDVVVRQPSAIGWFENDGNGSFGAFDTLHVSVGELGAFDMADVQGNGLPDLVVTDAGSDAILLLMGEGFGEFGLPQPVISMNGDLVGRLHLADVFAGPEPEILYNSGSIRVLENDGGTFGDAEVLASSGGFTRDLQVLDVDDDGDLDLAYFIGLTPTLALLLNPGVAGEPWAPVPNVVGNSLGRATSQVLDVDGDGDMDLANASSHNLVWWRFPLPGPDLFVPGGGLSGVSLEPFRHGTVARIGCGAGASMVWTDSIGEPVEWATYDAVLEGFGPVGFLPDLPSFLEIGAGDIDGDGKEDLVLWHDEDQLSWYRSIFSLTVSVEYDVLCSNGGAFPLSSEGTPAGGLYYLNDGTDPVEVLDPAVLTDSSYVLRYVYTDSETGCTGVDTTTFTVETCVGVSAQPMVTEELRIMPNPARAGFIRISYPRSAHLRIYDNTGRIVKELPYFSGTDVLDLSALAPGVYVLNLMAEGQARAERLVIE